MSMEWVRNYYSVPAKRGGRVIYTGEKEPRGGTIRSASNGRLNIQLDGMPDAQQFHPTWGIIYLKDHP